MGIVKSKGNGYHTFMDHIAPNFMYNTMRPSEYIQYCWNQYQAAPVEHTNSLNGSVFEIIIATLLVKEGIVPLLLQAQVAFVPNVIFDAVLYTSESGPVALSFKTSLRERYKQADLEAIALKYVHRKAENYLFTMDADEARAVSEKIAAGAVMGINRALLVTSTEFDGFIDELKMRRFITPGAIEIITASRVVDEDAINAATEQ